MQSHPRVIIVGGGVSGLTAALNLAQRAVSVTLVEREPALGGNALTVCCKALDGKCQLCGSCLIADRLAEARRCNELDVICEATVTRVESADGGFLLHVSGKSSTETLPADAIILATGYDHVDARAKGPYGYGIIPGVTTGEEMERRLKLEGQDAYDQCKPQQVAFVQCVGSRDEHVGRGYCSQVCCRYALRLARLLKRRYPGVELTVFKMDLQSCGRDMQSTWDALASEGIRLVAGLPAVIRRSLVRPGRASVMYDDILAGEMVQADFDLIVLSTGIQPRRDAAAVAEEFGLNRDRYGFYAVEEDATSTLVPGVFVAGCCQAPRSIADSAVHAEQAAQACYLYLQEGRA